jgi:chemotaxis protein methyltransferase CheR
VAALAAATPVLAPEVFGRLRRIVREHTGIDLGEHKRLLCQTRLARRLRALGLSRFEDYLRELDRPGSGEHAELVNAITTNVTAFFREPHHFELLASRVLPGLAADPARTRLRLWSAGCSSGEEPWSMAMVLDEARLPARWDVKILATDIDTDVLARARDGVYTADRLAHVGESRRQRYFSRGGGRSGAWQIAEPLRERVAFRALNLFAAWPMRRPFDVIFCRNVIIYFDEASKQQLVRRFVDALSPGGYLCLGHSESLLHGVDGLQPCGQTSYRKVG